MTTLRKGEVWYCIGADEFRVVKDTIGSKKRGWLIVLLDNGSPITSVCELTWPKGYVRVGTL